MLAPFCTKSKTFANACRDFYSCMFRQMKILPDPQSQTFVVMTSDKCARGACLHDASDVRCSIHYTRFTFDGQPIQNGRLQLPGFPGIDLVGFRPVDRRGGFSLEAAARRPRELGDCLIFLQFNEHLHTFVSPNCPVSNPGPWVKARTSWWEDSFYQVLPDIGTLPIGTSQTDTPETVLLAHLGTR